MADNTTRAVTSGGDVVRSIDRSGVKSQVTAIDLGGTTGERFPYTRAVDGGSTYALAVDPREQLSEITLTSAGLTTATTAYTAGDTLGTEITLSSIARANGGYATITNAVLVDKAAVVGAVDLYLFNAASSPSSNNAAANWADADMLNCLGVVHFGDIMQVSNNTLIQAVNLPLTIKCGSGTTSIFAVLVTRTGNAVFGAVGDLVAKLQIVQH